MGKNQFGPLWATTVGFDAIFAEMERMLETPSQSFPPHNVIKLDDYKYVVELATAGFSRDEIEVVVDDGYLIIKGEKKPSDDVTYLHKGIGTRTFKKSIKIPETVVVHAAQYNDGILRIGLENVIPEHKKPRQVEIGSEVPLFKQELLTE